MWFTILPVLHMTAQAHSDATINAAIGIAVALKMPTRVVHALFSVNSSPFTMGEFKREFTDEGSDERELIYWNYSLYTDDNEIHATPEDFQHSGIQVFIAAN